MSFNVFDIAATGMHAQRIKMDTVSSNIANVNTTRNEFGEKQVYHKKQVNFKEMAIKKDFGFPKGNVDVSFDPPSEPYLVGGVSIGNDAISKGVMVESITDAGDLEAARVKLCDILSNYAGFRKCYLVLVFDGWKTKGNPGEKSQYHNIQLVFTKEGETGDAYIESLVAQIGSNYAVRVASSDNLVQLSSFRTGVLRMSSRELLEEIESANREMAPYLQQKKRTN